ncbi:MAG: hypothetical protein ACOYO0_04925 [Sandarakinorhabdus sp.]
MASASAWSPSAAQRYWVAAATARTRLGNLAAGQIARRNQRRLLAFQCRQRLGVQDARSPAGRRQFGRNDAGNRRCHADDRRVDIRLPADISSPG